MKPKRKKKQKTKKKKYEKKKDKKVFEGNGGAHRTITREIPPQNYPTSLTVTQVPW
jgi:hypothetical protein